MYGKGEDGKAKSTSDPKQAGEWAGAVSKDPKALEARAVAGLKALTDQKIVDSKNIGAIGYCMGGTVALALARTGADLKAVVAFHASNIASGGDDKAAKDANAKIRATLLICHGQDDGFVQPGELEKFHSQMKAANVDYVLSAYSGAVHAFTNPKADEYKVPGVSYNKNADVRSWAAMKALLEEKFDKSDHQARQAETLRALADANSRLKQDLVDLQKELQRLSTAGRK
jgi:dienelactone hydrolase